jgi:16S rRNA U1498 N3-methylase RsmE
MNSLLIYPDEVTNEGLVILSGERARHAREDFHDVALGISVPAAIRDGNRGRATYKSLASERVELNFESTAPPLERTPATLIVAISRPQTIKKVIQAGVFLGIRELFLVKTDLTEKSYLSSRELRSERIAGEVERALEQTCDSISPIIEVGGALSELLRARREYKCAFFAHTGCGFDEGVPGLSVTQMRNDDDRCNKSSPDTNNDTIIAIGPEKGWSDREIRLFQECNFQPISLGERVLRVDAAVYVATTSLVQNSFRTSL